MTVNKKSKMYWWDKPNYIPLQKFPQSHDQITWLASIANSNTPLPQSQEQVAQLELKPERLVVGTNQTNQDRILRWEFLKHKTISPPNWREFPEEERSIYLWRFQGMGYWSALEYLLTVTMGRRASCIWWDQPNYILLQNPTVTDVAGSADAANGGQ